MQLYSISLACFSPWTTIASQIRLRSFVPTAFCRCLCSAGRLFYCATFLQARSLFQLPLLCAPSGPTFLFISCVHACCHTPQVDLSASVCVHACCHTLQVEWSTFSSVSVACTSFVTHHTGGDISGHKDVQHHHSGVHYNDWAFFRYVLTVPLLSSLLLGVLRLKCIAFLSALERNESPQALRRATFEVHRLSIYIGKEWKPPAILFACDSNDRALKVSILNYDAHVWYDAFLPICDAYSQSLLLVPTVVPVYDTYVLWYLCMVPTYGACLYCLVMVSCQWCLWMVIIWMLIYYVWCLSVMPSYGAWPCMWHVSVCACPVRGATLGCSIS